MPWTAAQAKQKKKDLTDAEAEKWAKIANSVLSECLSGGGNQEDCEANAIMTANSAINKARNSKEDSRMSKFKAARLSEMLSPVLEVYGVNSSERKATIKVIQPGISHNRTVYSHSNMQEIVDFINVRSQSESWVRMYMDHSYEEEGKPPKPRSIRDRVGVLTKAWLQKEESGVEVVHAEVDILQGEDANRILKEIEHNPKYLGVSIDGYALMEETEDAGDGQPGLIILQMTYLRSVDFVTEASAGGGIVTEALEGKELEDVIEQAQQIANEAKVAEGSRILEALEHFKKKLEPETTEEPAKEGAEIAPTCEEDDKDIVAPFSVELQKEKAEDEIYDLLWNMRSYLFKACLADEPDLATRIGYAKDAIEAVFTKVSSLLASIEAPAKEAIESKLFEEVERDPIQEAREIIKRNLVGVTFSTQKPVALDSMLEAAESLVKQRIADKRTDCQNKLKELNNL